MKRRKQIKIFKVDAELYPESPLLDVSPVWLRLEDRWLTPDLEPARCDIYEDHLYFDRRVDALDLVNEEIAKNEQALRASLEEYHKRLWWLAGLLIDEQ